MNDAASRNIIKIKELKQNKTTKNLKAFIVRQEGNYSTNTAGVGKTETYPRSLLYLSIYTHISFIQKKLSALNSISCLYYPPPHQEP